MRYQGYEPEDIAHALQIKVTTVNRKIDRAAASTADEHRASIVREAELLKLEEMEPPFLDQATQGCHKSAVVVLKLMERRAALLGSDKSPQQANNTVNNYNLVNILSNMARQPPPFNREAVDA